MIRSLGTLLSRVTAKLTERTFVAGLRRYRQLAFKHNFGKRRHFQIDGLAFYDIHGRARETAGDFQFVDADARLELGCDINRRRDADTNRDLELCLAALLGVFDEIVAIVAGRETDGDFVLRNQHHPVDR